MTAWTEATGNLAANVSFGGTRVGRGNGSSPPQYLSSAKPHTAGRGPGFICTAAASSIFPQLTSNALDVERRRGRVNPVELECQSPIQSHCTS